MRFPIKYFPALVGAVTGCDSLKNKRARGKSPRKSLRNIVDTAVMAGSFETLAAAIGAAGLVEVLKGPGPFTVFAPTDEAFASLPEGTIDALLEDKARLRSILGYHVIPGEVRAAKVIWLSEAETVGGQRVKIELNDSGVMIDNARVLKTDIHCSNGVIHVIDAVLLPPLEKSKQNIVKK